MLYRPNESFSKGTTRVLASKTKNGRNKSQMIKGFWYPTSTEFILRVVGNFERSQVMLKRKKWSVVQEGLIT